MQPQDVGFFLRIACWESCRSTTSAAQRIQTPSGKSKPAGTIHAANTPNDNAASSAGAWGPAQRRSWACHNQAVAGGATRSQQHHCRRL